MTTPTKVAIWIGSASLVLVAVLGLATFSATDVPFVVEQDGEPILADAALVWCDANRALVGLAAQTLDLLPSDLEDRPLDIVSDDPADNFSNLEGTSSLDTFRQPRSVAQDVPPEFLSDFGWSTEDGFETLSLMGLRSQSGAAFVTTEWISGFEGRWDHRDALRACGAAWGAFHFG